MTSIVIYIFILEVYLILIGIYLLKTARYISKVSQNIRVFSGIHVSISFGGKISKLYLDGIGLLVGFIIFT